MLYLLLSIETKVKYSGVSTQHHRIMTLAIRLSWMILT